MSSSVQITDNIGEPDNVTKEDAILSLTER